MRAALQEIPEHLKPFIAKQDPSLYTPIDHASWRFILRVSKSFFSKNAHQKYVDGLNETGISTERIPLIEEMDHCLRRFGWRAVAVSGFIPPAVFMEFQSLGILPIACEMRTLEHLAYTPAPDIVHEAAGHAPIIADPEYSEYLRAYGEVSRKAIFSDKDMEVYETIRSLSDIKENPKSTAEEIQAAQKRLDDAAASVDYLSEATLLSRMNWWTVEYGLVGTPENPKIYGAGLLSSVGESYHCLSPAVKKLPFSLDCIDTGYDITRPQPQLFVTPDFHALTRALEDFAKTMAFRQGHAEGLKKAKQARSVTTAVLDSGLQVGGVLADYIQDSQGRPVYLKYQGPTQLAYQDQELPDQGPKYHAQGFSSPVGKLAGMGKSPAQLSEAELNQLGFGAGKSGVLKFESGVEVRGKLSGTTRRADQNLILSFTECTVKLGDQVLFQPDWGTFDMACGENVVSVFGGAPDRRAYLQVTGGFRQSPKKPKSNLTNENRRLNELYAQVRSLRESGQDLTGKRVELQAVYEELVSKYPGDWLLLLELLELDARHGLGSSWAQSAKKKLLSVQAPDQAQMIQRGLALIG